MQKPDDLQKKYFLHLTKGTSIVLYIDDYHVSEIINPPDTNFGIGLSKDYKRIRFYHIDNNIESTIDHKRFIHIPYSDYYIIQNYLTDFTLPNFLKL